MRSKAVDVAKNSLHKVLQKLSSLEEQNKDVEDACDNVRDVLDQLCNHCRHDLKLFGKITDFGKRA